MGRLSYTELSKKRIKPTRNIVVSKAMSADGENIGYSIAEQIVMNENGKETKVFMRGGIGILSADGLLELQRAINESVEKAGLSPTKQMLTY